MTLSLGISADLARWLAYIDSKRRQDMTKDDSKMTDDPRHAGDKPSRKKDSVAGAADRRCEFS
jgi:hypothetical protein